jgi:hypothetical protein
MGTTHRVLLRSSLAASFALLASAFGAAGDGKNYSFQTPPANAMGTRSLADLRGKPVLIDFWGTR